MTTMTYTGAGNTGNWSDAKNWKGGVAPGVSDTALLVGGADSTVTAPVTINNIMILSTQSVTFDGAVTTYGLGNCKGFMVCESGTATFAPGSSLADGGVLQAGLEATGTFVAVGTTAKATTLQAKRTELGKEAEGNGFMTIDGASLTNSAGLYVGEAGKGTLNVLDGGSVSAAYMTIGDHVGATGQVFLSGTSTITIAGTASVGGFDKGSVTGSGTISVGAGSTLHAVTEVKVVTGSSVTMAGGTLSAGDKNGGTNVMTGGSIVGAGTLTTRTGGYFKIDGLLEAKGGTLDVQGNLIGIGTLTIDAGSTVSVDGKSLLLPKITFAGAGSTLVLAQGASVTGELDGFTFGDAIKMAGVAAAGWNTAMNVLTLTSAGHTIDRLHLGGSFAGDKFTVTQQGGVGVITLQHVT